MNAEDMAWTGKVVKSLDLQPIMAASLQTVAVQAN